MDTAAARLHDPATAQAPERVDDRRATAACVTDSVANNGRPGMGGPLNRSPRLIEGEEELGPQKQCLGCGEFFPADLEFFYKDGNGLTARCKVCWNEQQRPRAAA